MTRENAKAWLRRFGDLPDELRLACRYGHPGCSIDHRGDCFDEVIKAAIPPDAPPSCDTD